MELYAARQIGGQRGRLLSRCGGVDDHMAERPREPNLVRVGGKGVICLRVDNIGGHICVGRLGNHAEHSVNHLIGQLPQISDGESVGELGHGLLLIANRSEVKHRNTSSIFLLSLRIKHRLVHVLPSRTYAVPYTNAFSPAAAWYVPLYLYFGFALYERKTEIQKKMQ